MSTTAAAGRPRSRSRRTGRTSRRGRREGRVAVLVDGGDLPPVDFQRLGLGVAQREQARRHQQQGHQDHGPGLRHVARQGAD
jgi:hypothetical protein